VTSLPNHAVRDAAWVVQFPADRLDQSDTGLPVLWTASANGVRAALSGTLFEPDLLAKRLSLPADAVSNPATLALEAYLQLGDRWLHTLGGHYAVIVDDRRSGRFFAARDAMGIHPLFFAEANGALLLSWSTDALVSHPGVSRELNRVALAEHLLHRWSDPAETYFAAVQRVPPGYVLEVEGNSRRLRRYWDPSASGGVQWLRKDEVEQFDYFLERAVTRCLARGRVGIFLSGGFDSVSIAAVAVDVASRTGQRVPYALSLGFPDPICNEEIVQRRVAHSLGMPQDYVGFHQAVGERGLLLPAVEMSASWPAPMLNLWNPAYTYLARRGREQGCSTILTGSGGDEWLTVTPYLAADHLRHGQFAEVFRQVAMVRRSYNISAFEAARGSLWTYGARPLVCMLADRIAPNYWQQRRHRNVAMSTPSWVAPDPALRRQIDDRAGRVLGSSQPYNGTFYEREMRSALVHPLNAMEAEEYFEISRRFGVQMMHPYWDADLVDLLYRTPPHLLSKNGRSKGLVRETVARRFPKLGFESQRKMQATNFYRKSMEAEGLAAWNALGKASALADLRVVDPCVLSDTMADLFAGRRPQESYRIWNTLRLEAWVRSRA
jgi:asparagine synthetase B (glutamine-hydrolysing)